MRLTETRNNSVFTLQSVHSRHDSVRQHGAKQTYPYVRMGI